VTLRNRAIERAGKLGPDAVQAAMDEIDAMQKKGTLDNLYRARMLVEQGNDTAAAEYLERANSYMGNFTALITSPARMRDGSTRVAFEARDEQTGQPQMPATMVTPEVLDGLIGMIENEGNWSNWSFDRDMAMREYDLKRTNAEWKRDWEQYKFDANQQRYDREYELDASEYNLKLAKAMQEAAERTQDRGYDPSDWTGEVKNYVELLPPRPGAGSFDPETGEQIPDEPDPQMVADFVYYFQKAANDPTLSRLRPDEIARHIYNRLTRGTTSGGASN
jgi:hypothetical protein